MQTGLQNPPLPPPVTPKPPSAELAAWAEMLLAKFPEFDPAWTDDVKAKWFDAFDRLMKGRGM